MLASPVRLSLESFKSVDKNSLKAGGEEMEEEREQGFG